MAMFITPIKPMEYISEQQPVAAPTQPAGGTFQNVLKQAVEQLEASEQVSTAGSYDLALGDVNNIAQLQIDSMKAQAMLQTTVQLTTRMVNAYKEIMQMQI